MSFLQGFIRMPKSISRRILVTGASGFVGTFLLERLIASIHANAMIIAAHTKDLDASFRSRFTGNVIWKRVDITTDDLSELVTGVDTVFHLAAHSTVSEAESSCRQMERVNVYGTRRLGDACKTAGVQHFIFVSSIAACETGPSKIIDEENGAPTSTYGKTKKSAEELLLEMAGNGFEVTILRPTALFGEDHLGSIFELAKAIEQGRFVIFGSGANPTNFYYVRDFVDVLICVQHNPKAYGQVFIAADEACSLYELVSFISTELGSRRILRVPTIVGAGIARGCDVASNILGTPLPLSTRRFRAMTRDTAYSNKKMTGVLGILPAYGLLIGVKKALAYYRQAGLIDIHK